MTTATTPLVSVAVKSYVAGRSLVLSPLGARTEERLLLRFAASVRDKQVGRVAADDYLSFLADLRSGLLGRNGLPIRDSSLGRYASKLRGFAAYCQSRGWVKTNPFPPASLGGMRLRDNAPRRDFLRLSAREILTMLDLETEPRERCILAVGANTGLRSKEAVSIRLGDVDLDQGEFYVIISKSALSDRVPISSDLRKELDRYLSWYRGQCGALSPSWWLFPAKSPYRYGGADDSGQRVPRAHTFYPERPANPKVCRIAVDRGLERLGYTEEQRMGEGFHTLRRSVARLYFDDLASEQGYGNALRDVAALLHHKSVQTTELYLGLDADRARRDVRMRDKPFLSKFAESSAGTAVPAQLTVVGG